MRSMGMHAHSELIAWILISFAELFIIFMLVSLVLYIGGILVYTNWFFMMFYCLVFGACLISFWCVFELYNFRDLPTELPIFP